MTEGVIDWAEEKAKEAAKTVLPTAVYDELRKDYHKIVDPIHAIEKTVDEFKNLTSPGGLSAAAASLLGTGGDGNPPPQQQDGGSSGNGQSAPGIDTGGSWGSKIKHFLGLDNQPAAGNNGPSSGDGSSSDNPLGGIGGFIKNFMSNPLGAIIGLVIAAAALIFGLLSGAGSLFSGIASAFGFGSDDAPGGNIVDRAETAYRAGKQTFETMKKETPVQFFKDAAKRIGDEAHVITEGVTHDVKFAGDTMKRAKYAVDYLVNVEHVDRVHAIGMVANYMCESGLNPGENKGDGGQAYGIGEWHPDRQANFAAWSGRSIKGSSLEQQLSFAAYEWRQGGEKGTTYAHMMAATTPEEAAAAYCINCERPQDKPGQARLRAATAEKLAAYDQQQGSQQGMEVASSSPPPKTPQVLGFSNAAQALGG